MSEFSTCRSPPLKYSLPRNIDQKLKIFCKESYASLQGRLKRCLIINKIHLVFIYSDQVQLIRNLLVLTRTRKVDAKYGVLIF